MRMLTSSRRVLVALMALLIGIAAADNAPAAPQSPNAVELHPNCGQVFTVRINKPTTVLTSVSATAFAVSCFGHAFVGTSPSCTPSSTDGKVMLNVTFSGQTETIDLTSLYRGSTFSSQFQFATPALFVMYAVYSGTCSASLALTTYVTGSGFGSGYKTVPFLVASEPLYAATGSALTYTFRDLQTNASPMQYAAMLLPVGKTCSANAAAAYPSANSSAVAVNSVGSLTWTSAPVAINGQYRVCMRTNGNWFSTGIVEIFGGNPTYFKATRIRQTRGDVSISLAFSGFNLDATRDTAVFASDDGSPCGKHTVNDASVQVNGFVNDGKGHSVVALTISTNMAPAYFMVCYYVAASSTWSSVPDFDSLTREVINNLPTIPTSGTNTNVTTPPPPSSRSCVTAPYNTANEAVTTNQVIAVAIRGSSMPSTFVTDTASLLCILPAEVVVMSFTSGVPTSTLVFKIACGSSQCNSAERQAAYLANYKSLTATTSSAVMSATSQTHSGLSVPASDDNAGKRNATAIGLGVGLGVAVILLIGAIIAIILLRRQRAARVSEEEDVVDGHVVQGHVVNVGSVRSAWPYAEDAAADDVSRPEPLPPTPGPVTKEEPPMPPAAAFDGDREA